MTNLEKLIHMRSAADHSAEIAESLRAAGHDEKFVALTLEGYRDGLDLFDKAVEAYALVAQFGRLEQMRRDGRGLMSEEREEKAALQRKFDDFAVKLHKAG